MSKKYLLVLDAGSGGGKCFICDTEGQEVGTAFSPWMRLAWSPEIGWAGLKEAIRGGLAKSGIQAKDIIAISFTTMREEFVLFDRDGKEHFIPFSMELFAEGKTLDEKLAEEMYLSSGHWPGGFMPAVKLLWLKKTKPEVFDRLETFLMISDWMAYKLSGEAAVEPSGVCETCLFDLSTRDFSKKLMSKVGIPSNIFPKVVESGTLLGSVTKKVAEETGLNEGTPTIVGGADTQCGLLGSGCVEDDNIAAVGGTTTPVQLVTSKPILDPKFRCWTNCHIVDDKWLLESNAGSTGWAFRWVRNALGDLEVAAAKATGLDAYDLLTTEAENAEPGSGGLLAYLGPGIMNVRGGLFGRRNALLGLNVRSGPGVTMKRDIARATIEGACYAVRGNVEQIEEVTGNEIDELRFCGGNTKSRLWTQIQADVLNLPVKVPVVREATALGAALLAGLGIELYPNIVEATETIVKWLPTVKPRKDIAQIYERYYKQWIEGYYKL